MNDGVIKINTAGIRTDLTKYLKDYKGEAIYITKYYKLVAELIVYTEEIRAEIELELARKMLQSAKREHKRL